MHKNMYYKNLIIDIFAVTFRKEGVDWNVITPPTPKYASMSPSARKVWIEISHLHGAGHNTSVTFRKEGVDWNACIWLTVAVVSGHLPQGRCGLKYRISPWSLVSLCHLPQGRCGLKCRIWFRLCCPVTSSPSARKVWIEIINSIPFSCKTSVTFRKEGVDWNWKYRAVRSGADVTFRKEGVDWNP